MQVAAALVQAGRVLSKLLIARFLYTTEEIQSASSDGAAFSQAFSWVVELLLAQHEFLRISICLADDVTRKQNIKTHIVLVLTIFAQVEGAGTQGGAREVDFWNCQFLLRGKMNINCCHPEKRTSINLLYPKVIEPVPN